MCTRTACSCSTTSCPCASSASGAASQPRERRPAQRQGTKLRQLGLQLRTVPWGQARLRWLREDQVGGERGRGGYGGGVYVCGRGAGFTAGPELARGAHKDLAHQAGQQVCACGATHFFWFYTRSTALIQPEKETVQTHNRHAVQARVQPLRPGREPRLGEPQAEYRPGVDQQPPLPRARRPLRVS